MATSSKSKQASAAVEAHSALINHMADAQEVLGPMLTAALEAQDALTAALETQVALISQFMAAQGFREAGEKIALMHSEPSEAVEADRNDLEAENIPGFTVTGDVVVVHCCNECARKAGVSPKRPADSGKASWLCAVCGHHGIGSLTDCEIVDWLRLRPLQPNAEVTGGPLAERPVD